MNFRLYRSERLQTNFSCSPVVTSRNSQGHPMIESAWHRAFHSGACVLVTKRPSLMCVVRFRCPRLASGPLTFRSLILCLKFAHNARYLSARWIFALASFTLSNRSLSLPQSSVFICLPDRSTCGTSQVIQYACRINMRCVIPSWFAGFT